MKFILVAEKTPVEFSKSVQKYLDEGYHLKGDTFTTPVYLNKHVVYWYNQILVKDEPEESVK